MKSDIKFTFYQSMDEVSFLDVCVKIKEGVTTVYSKPRLPSVIEFEFESSEACHPQHSEKLVPAAEHNLFHCLSSAAFASGVCHSDLGALWATTHMGQWRNWSVTDASTIPTSFTGKSAPVAWESFQVLITTSNTLCAGRAVYFSSVASA